MQHEVALGQRCSARLRHRFRSIRVDAPHLLHSALSSSKTVYLSPRTRLNRFPHPSPATLPVPHENRAIIRGYTVGQVANGVAPYPNFIVTPTSLPNPTRWLAASPGLGGIIAACMMRLRIRFRRRRLTSAKAKVARPRRMHAATAPCRHACMQPCSARTPHACMHTTGTTM